mgnify:FL=1
MPGDGVHVVWQALLGLNRARYFLLTGQVLSASEALALGVVNEVLPQGALLDRAWVLARQLRARPHITNRLTREAMLIQLKRQMLEQLPYGLALEGLAAADWWPTHFEEKDISKG